MAVWSNGRSATRGHQQSAPAFETVTAAHGVGEGANAFTRIIDAGYHGNNPTKRPIPLCIFNNTKITEKNLPAPSLSRWMDGYRNYNADYGCTIAVLAENENNARNKIQKEFAENVAKGGSMQTFEKWIASGKPVEENERNFYKPAVFGSLESILKPLA